MKRTLLVAALGILTAQLALAAPLQQKKLPATTQWLVHVDLEAFRQAACGPQLQEAMEEAGVLQPLHNLALGVIGSSPRFTAEARLSAKVIGELGIDNVRGITSFSHARDTSLVIIDTTVELQRLEDGVAGFDGYQMTTYNSHKVHQWAEGAAEGTGAKPQTAYAVFLADGGILLGYDLPAMKEVLDGLDGKAKTLGGGGTLQAPPGAEGAFLVVAAADFPQALPAVAAKLPVLSRLGAVSLTAAEKNAGLQVNLSIAAGQAGDAAKIGRALAGLAATASLATEPDAELARVFDAIQVTTADRTVTAALQLPVRAIVALAERGQARALFQGRVMEWANGHFGGSQQAQAWARKNLGEEPVVNRWLRTLFDRYRREKVADNAFDDWCRQRVREAEAAAAKTGA